jgi:dihydrofolate synthase/folylpolyglutamate synthase
MKDVHWPIPLGSKPIDLGLERVLEALEKMGNPHHKLPPVIHIAGTNGKGSTLAFLRAILEQKGLRCHAYTSPHLVEFNERIMLSGQLISDDFLYNILEETRKVTEGVNLTYFEGTTLAAILAFSKIKADYVLLETGMGGRLDATNIIDKPALNIITPISYDHMEFLGDTIAKIAYEKAHIMKQNVKCVVAPQLPEAAAVIKNEAAKIGAILVDDFKFFAIDEFSFDYSYSLLLRGSRTDEAIQKDEYKNLDHHESKDARNDKYIEFKNLKPSLLGEHQFINAATAIAAALNLDVGITEQQIRSGLANAVWPARMQNISEYFDKNITQNSQIFLDGGHNADGAKVIAQVASGWQKQNAATYAIIGMVKTKDEHEFLNSIKNSFDGFYFIDIPDEPNSKDKNLFLNAAQTLAIANFQTAESFEDAIKQIVKVNKAQSKIQTKILICGSLYLAGKVLEKIT